MLKKGTKYPIVLIVLMLVIVSLTGCGTKKISLEDYVSVSMEGYSGYATASIFVDYQGLNSIVDQKKILKYTNSLPNNIYSDYVTFSDLLKIEFLSDDYFSNGNFSNGDSVPIVVDVSDELASMGETFASLQKNLGIAFESDMVQIAVPPLPEAQVIDVMNFVDNYIVYEGADGGATATIQFPEDFTYETDGFVLARGRYANQLKIIKDYTLIKEIIYECEYEGYLSEGQTFNVVIKDDDVTVGDSGYIINTKRECSVSGLGKYIRSKDELTLELRDFILEDVWFQGMERVMGYYWGTIKPSTETDNLARDYNRLYILYTTINKSYYRMTEIKDIIKMPDGTYSIKETFGSLRDIDPDDPKIDNYDLEKIDW